MIPCSYLPRIGYVVKRYPRYSETFIVNEILAHEKAGLSLDIFALRPSNDTHFQDNIAKVRAPITYLPAPSALSVSEFWSELMAAIKSLPDWVTGLDAAQYEVARDVYQAALLALQAREKGIEHLHAHFATSATTVARLAALFAGLTYSFTAHAKDIFHESVQHHDLQKKISDATSVITVSNYNVDFLQNRFGHSASKVQRIYNGLDLLRLPYSDPHHRPPRIVAVGRLIEKKGFCDLIAACAELHKRNIDFECQIIGGGPLQDTLVADIHQRGLQNKVKTLGPLPQKEVIACLQQTAVFAAPCVVGLDGNRDGLPTVLLEAMALGVPCISTDVTGIPEAIKHNHSGLIVPQKDVAALTDALAHLLLHSQERTRLAQHARRLIEQAFDIDQNTAALRSVFDTATSNNVLKNKKAG
ncbi:MAG: glycosyltransferase family 4 protein [Gammaproteobacteria bacterium]|nr:glycosyltransferase family 4 protein [Gammaproteobacteria bacterium]MCF6260127.1 glycosyltransferase family 4 protein [Gammaproteobacteria bacterium]